jgi:hypothetical protein
VPGARCRVSGDGGDRGGARCQVSGVRGRGRPGRCQVPGVGCQGTGATGEVRGASGKAKVAGRGSRVAGPGTKRRARMGASRRRGDRTGGANPLTLAWLQTKELRMAGAGSHLLVRTVIALSRKELGGKKGLLALARFSRIAPGVRAIFQGTKTKVQRPKARVSSPGSRVAGRGSRAAVQRPKSKVQRPGSRVPGLGSRVASSGPKTKVQRSRRECGRPISDCEFRIPTSRDRLRIATQARPGRPGRRQAPGVRCRGPGGGRAGRRRGDRAGREGPPRLAGALPGPRSRRGASALVPPARSKDYRR